MHKSVAIGSACGVLALLAGSLGAAPTWSETPDGKYEVVVPAGESHALTAADVAAIGTRDLVKSGEGTLVAGEEMAAFAHDIYVTNGVYTVEKQGGLGSVLGVVTHTYVSGSGTLENKVRASGGWDVWPSFGSNEWVHVEGVGFNGQGAIVNNANSSCLAHRLLLTGDTRIAVPQSADLRQHPVDMGGHRIELKGASGAALRFVSHSAENPGDIDVDGTGLGFEGGSHSRSGHMVTVHAGGGLQFRKASNTFADRLLMATNTYLEATDGSITFGKVQTPNLWSGPVELQGAVTTKIKPDCGITLGGYVSGEGGFTGGNGGWLQLACPTNAFRGGVTAISPASLAGPTGGVAVVANGAVPADGGPVVIGNSSLWLAAVDRIDLPALEVRGAGRVDCAALKGVDAETADAHLSLTNAVVASLRKTDAGTLDLVGAVKVTGATEISGGTLRLASRVPAAEGGLDTWYARHGVQLYYRGICPEGVSAAYHWWPYSGSGKPGDPSYVQSYDYKGYIRIPDDEGETKRCNFISSMRRYVKVTIAGKTVVDGADNDNNIEGGGNAHDWNHLYMNPPVDLPSGWQPISVYCGNTYNSSRGPQDNTDRGWAKDFGIGVDWQHRCETNVANYVKLVDPGDGSFLRRSLTEKDAIDPTPYRATFDGPMAFGAGTTLDLNDVEPYTPLAVSELIGTPAVTNGAVTVTGATWTLRAADLKAGGCLSIAANARVSFPAQVTVDVADVENLRQKGNRYRGGAILVAADGAFPEGTEFRLSEATRAARWRLERSGNTLSLLSDSGILVIFR